MLPGVATTDRRAPAGAVVWTAAGALGLAAVTWVSLQAFGPLALTLSIGAFAPLLIVMRPELGVLALTSTFFLSYPDALTGTGYFTINNLLGLMLAGILLVRIGTERRVDVLRHRGVQLAALVTVLVVASAMLSESAPPFRNLASLDLTEQRVHEVITKLAFLVFVLTFIRARWQVTLLAGAVVLFVAMTAPSAIGNALGATAANAEKVRASADFGIVAARNANRLAFVSAIAIALTGYALTAIRGRLARAAGALLIGVLVLTVFLSASRSGLINLLVLCVLFAARAGLGRRTILALALGLTLALGSVVALAPAWVGPDAAGRLEQADWRQGPSLQVYLQRITSFVIEGDEPSGVAGSTRARTALLQLGLQMAADHPLMGVGVGNYRWVSVVDYGNPHFSALHNSYVLTLVEGGLVLFAAYLLLFRHTWKEIAETRRLSAAGRAPALGWLADATRAMLVLFLVFSFFADLWHDVYLYLIVGLSGVLARLHAGTEPAA